MRPARLAILVAGSAGLGSIAAIGSRLIDHRCVTTTSTSPRFDHSGSRSLATQANRSCPLPAFAGDGATSAAIVCQPAAGSTGRNRRWSLTNSWANRHAPSLASGSSTVHRGRPSLSATLQPRTTLPPLTTGRAPAAARMTVGDCSVPASSGTTTSVSASSCRPSATSTTTGAARPGSAARISRTRSSARRSETTGASAAPVAASLPAGDTCTSADRAGQARLIAKAAQRNENVRRSVLMVCLEILSA